MKYPTRRLNSIFKSIRILNLEEVWFYIVEIYLVNLPRPALEGWYYKECEHSMKNIIVMKTRSLPDPLFNHRSVDVSVSKHYILPLNNQVWRDDSQRYHLDLYQRKDDTVVVIILSTGKCQIRLLSFFIYVVYIRFYRETKDENCPFLVYCNRNIDVPQRKV